MKRFKHFIEETRWDEVMEENHRWLDYFCWAMIVIAIAYFFPPFIAHVLFRA